MAKYHYLGMYSFDRHGDIWYLDYTYGKSERTRTKRGTYAKLMQFAAKMEDAPRPCKVEVWSIYGKNRLA